MSANTGGHAFPTGNFTCDVDGNIRSYPENGMTMRDYFAAKALQGLIAIGPGGHNMSSFQMESAKWAYGYSDAMLAVREVE